MTLGALLLIQFLLFEHNLIILLLSIACINGIGIATAFTTLTVLAVKKVAEQDHGLASSIATTAYFFGGGLGLSLLSIFIQETAGNQVTVVPALILLLFPLAGVVWLIRYDRKQ
jgi:predicted MFS family arabinose efflux permease